MSPLEQSEDVALAGKSLYSEPARVVVNKRDNVAAKSRNACW